MMACRNISEQNVMNILKNGDVNFEESNVRNTPRPYYAMEGAIAGDKIIRVIVTTIDSIAEIETAIALEVQKDSCDCK